MNGFGFRAFVIQAPTVSGSPLKNQSTIFLDFEAEFVAETPERVHRSLSDNDHVQPPEEGAETEENRFDLEHRYLISYKSYL